MSTMTSYQQKSHRSENAGITLHQSNMAKLLPSTTFPALTSDVPNKKLGQTLSGDKSCTKVTKKKFENVRTVPATTTPTSASGQRKRVGGTAKTKHSPGKHHSSSTNKNTPPAVSLTSINKNQSPPTSLSSINKNQSPPSSLSSISKNQSPPTSLSSISKNQSPQTSLSSISKNQSPQTSLSSISKNQSLSVASISKISSASTSLTSLNKDPLSSNVGSSNKPIGPLFSEKVNPTPPEQSPSEKNSLKIAKPVKKRGSSPGNRRQNNSLKLKDEEPKTPLPLELKSGNQFYLPKRKLVHKPVEPFTLFITEKHAVARLVWLYLLESQMPFKKISITSKEAEKATHSVPAYCKHCIFIDEDSTLGQPTAIIRHLCNYYTNNLLMGGDTSQISQGFSWVHWAVSVLHRDLFYLGSSELKRGSHTTNELQKSSLDSVSVYFDMLDKIFSTRAFLLGTVAWFCDSAVALVLEDASSLSLTRWPRLLEWLQRVKKQPNWEVVTNT